MREEVDLYLLRAAERRELATDQLDRVVEARLVRGRVQPAADTGGMGERHGDRVGVRKALADRGIEARETEQAPNREPADRDDQPGPQQPQLPIAPERAEILLG